MQHMHHIIITKSLMCAQFARAAGSAGLRHAWRCSNERLKHHDGKAAAAAAVAVRRQWQWRRQRWRRLCCQQASSKACRPLP